MLLVTLHIINRPVLIGIVLIEFILFLYIFISGKNVLICPIFMTHNYLIWGKRIPIVKILTIIAAIISVVWVINLFVNNLGTIFTDNDVVGAYNVWAGSLTQGKVPPTAYYPMLIVSNWAAGYAISGCTLQFAAKAMMPL